MNGDGIHVNEIDKTGREGAMIIGKIIQGRRK
jgi:hypothetical protein